MERIDTTRKTFSLAASVVVGLYLSLALVAFFCATSHANHHGHQASHSSLCTWACQANNSVSLISLATPILPILLAITLFELLITSPLTHTKVFHTPRGPPQF